MGQPFNEMWKQLRTKGEKTDPWSAGPDALDQWKLEGVYEGEGAGVFVTIGGRLLTCSVRPPDGMREEIAQELGEVLRETVAKFFSDKGLRKE